MGIMSRGGICLPVTTDPGFLVGGVDLVEEGIRFKDLYVEMKESGPSGGRAPGTPLDPPM